MALQGDRVFIHSSALDEIPYPADCPFNSSRAGRTREALLSMGLLNGPHRREVAPVPLPRRRALAFHTAAYVEALECASRRELSYEALMMGIGTPDCPVFDRVLDYALLASGAGVDGAAMLLAEEAVVAFNPSGGYHHAFPARAAGFCYLNDVVLACLSLTAAGKRVLFLDVDVHHCDGVQSAFYARRDVMTVSLHETGRTLFPGTGSEDEVGTGEGRGYCVNVPLPAGTYDEVYIRAFRSVVPPLVEAYAPDVLVVEAGADALAGDPLAHLQLTNNVYPEVIETLLSFDRPMLVTGGGGYHVENTVRAWSLIWATVCGEECQDDMLLGMGGVMMESTDWLGGLRDRVLAPDPALQGKVDAAVAATVDRVRESVFPLHGL